MVLKEYGHEGSNTQEHESCHMAVNKNDISRVKQH
jgi:hypothetical protein